VILWGDRAVPLPGTGQTGGWVTPEAGGRSAELRFVPFLVMSPNVAWPEVISLGPKPLQLLILLPD